MENGTPIVIGNHFENFINEEISSGRYTSINDVVITALRLLENEEEKLGLLRKELEQGENSLMKEDFNPTQHLKALHLKHA